MVKASIELVIREYPNDLPMAILENLSEEIVKLVEERLNLQVQGLTSFG